MKRADGNPTAERIAIESDERGFELHVYGDDGLLYVFNVQGIAEELYDQVKARIGPWLQEMDDARREYRTGVADDPTQQEVLDRIKYGPVEKPDVDGYSGFDRGGEGPTGIAAFYSARHA